MTSRFAFAMLLVVLCATLTACGQKGPLVRPDGSAPAAAQSAQAPAPELPSPVDNGSR